MLKMSRVLLTKRAWGKRVTTVFPRQGHYALDDRVVDSYPAADYTLSRIGELVNLDFQALADSSKKQPGAAD